MKPKAEMMRRLRKERRDKGLVEFRKWVSPAHKIRLEQWPDDAFCGPGDCIVGLKDGQLVRESDGAPVVFFNYCITCGAAFDHV